MEQAQQLARNRAGDATATEATNSLRDALAGLPDDYPINLVFDVQEHWVSSVDGKGGFVILSLFRQRPPDWLPEADATACFVRLMIRAHDNIREHQFIPSNVETCRRFLNESKEYLPATTCTKVDYAVCRTLVANLVRRMSASDKIATKEQQVMISLYSRASPAYEPPSIGMYPAPSIGQLWLHLHRPEYFLWQFYDLPNRQKNLKLVATPAAFQAELDVLKKQEYVRNRVAAMLRHMSMWHALRGEHDAAAWLNCELHALETAYTISEDAAMAAFESSIIVHMMLGPGFKLSFRDMQVVRDDEIVDPSGLGLPGVMATLMRTQPCGPTCWDEAFDNFRMARCDMFLRGGALPANLYINATIATAPSASSVPSPPPTAAAGVNSERSAIRDLALTLKKTSCSVCGFKAGKQLKKCSKCKSVAYCCREHQLLDWKRGHKQQCAVSDKKHVPLQ